MKTLAQCRSEVGWLVVSALSCGNPPSLQNRLSQQVLKLQRQLEARALRALWIVSASQSEADLFPGQEVALWLPPQLAGPGAQREQLGQVLQEAQAHWKQSVLRSVVVQGPWECRHGDLLARSGFHTVISWPKPLRWPRHIFRRRRPLAPARMGLLRYCLRHLPLTHELPHQLAALAQVVKRRCSPAGAFLHLGIRLEQLASSPSAWENVLLALDLAQELVHRGAWCCVTPDELACVLGQQSSRTSARSILRPAA